MATSPKLVDSKQIKSTSLHVIRSIPSRLYFWPFICIYLLWIGIWVYLTRIEPEIIKAFIAASKLSNAHYPFLTLGFWIQYEEFMLIPLGFLATVHFITIMGCSWNIKFNAFMSYCTVNSVEKAEYILVTPQEHCGKAELCLIEREAVAVAGAVAEAEAGSLIFSYQQRKFYWNSDKKMFEKPVYPDNLCFTHYSSTTGLSTEEADKTMNRFGKNEFDLPVPTFMSLFKEHIQAPFFVFQIFCVAIWCLDEYWYYSVFTLVMLVIFESKIVQDRLKTLQEFRGMSVPTIDMLVFRSSKWLSIKSNELVPGDICALPFGDKVESDGLTMPCDLILLQGSCIVNEAMISGESTPLLKESIEDCDGNELIDMADSDRNHVLFGGTKVLQIHANPSTLPSTLPAPDGLNCPFIIGYAARTGFGTLQGKLVRTMIYSSEQVSANNKEAFLFIGFLLIFAIIAAGYVLVKGVEEEGKSRYKLLIECTLIITSVVPTELPIQLSLAVTNSIQELSKYAIFCMEPFRIPLAGKVDICCFDKTGTITAENLIVEGLAGLDSENPSKIMTDSSFEGFGETGNLAQKVMGVCNSLFLVRDNQVAGDPMEKATLEFLNWSLSASDQVFGRGKKCSYQIIHRFAFSSALKRMSVIAKDSIDGKLFVAVKGAPEVLQSRFIKVPSWYESTFNSLAQSGARVISLGYSPLPSNSAIPKSFKQAHRDDFEKNLIFCGFLVFRCPLKKDSRSAIRLLRNSAHRVIMITGDNSLTAIHTAKEVEMISKESSILLFDLDEEDETKLRVIEDGVVCEWLNVGGIERLRGKETLEEMRSRNVSLCFTGNAYDLLARVNPDLSITLLPQTAIFARTSPTQKESILAKLKSPPLSYNTLMCGDGTNDVGALKQAHIGIALLDGRPEDLPKILKEMRDSMIRKHQKTVLETRKKWESATAVNGSNTAALDKMLASLDQAEADGNNLVKLGDASVAAPFTSKISTIQSVCTLIRLGRSTLVTTIQMYKILALNSLIYAYNFSVLNLAGVRYGDFQMTVSGMLISAAFMFLTRGQVLKEMAPQRPQSNIFNLYLITSVMLQFALHVAVLIYVAQNAMRFEIPWKVTEKLKFQPGLLNTAIYLLGNVMQVSTFVVNYQGRPFRESLMENKPLRNSLLIVGAICVIATFELYPEFNEWLELVPMPAVFKTKLILALSVDFFGCFVIEWISKKLFFSDRPKLQLIL